MIKVLDRFLRYVSFDTASADDAGTIPSTQKQFELGHELAREMKEMGLSDVRIDDHCYVYGFIPANIANAPSLGFIAHMDTVPECPGKDIHPRTVKDYDGSIIKLNEELSLDPVAFPELLNYKGQDIIVTDGTTLLGADDKAGVAEILTMAEYLLSHPEIKHGRIAIGFTPDEEVGCGADMFDVEGFGAQFAYTVDGGALGELEYENFNAANAIIRIVGREIHPGSAKNAMLNAIHVAEEFDSLLPAQQRPEHTEGYEGFFHLMSISGRVDSCGLGYIIRDHDTAKFEAKKQLILDAADYINKKYGQVLTVEMKDSYLNMKEQILPHMHLIDTAKAAFEAVGVTPAIVPVRGGTDGARLSYMGLPCPNLSTGGHNFHGRLEYIPVKSLEKMVETLVKIVELTYSK